MPGRRWPLIASRLAHMDRPELLDRTRQELSKRSDAFLARFGFDFSRGMIPQETVRGGTPSSARFFFSPASVESIFSLLRERLPQQFDQIVRQADKICGHKFDLLGYEDLNYGDPIQWH